MSLMKLMSRYGLVGVINTLVHWLVFFILHGVMLINQAYSNVFAFLVAVTGSFYLNAHFTFKTHITIKRYLLFAVFMGSISYGVGYLADMCALPPLMTLVIFTAISFVVGFVWSNYLVFKG